MDSCASIATLRRVASALFFACVLLCFTVRVGAVTNDTMRIIRWKISCQTNVVSLQSGLAAESVTGVARIAQFFDAQLPSFDERTVLILDQPGASECHRIKELIEQVRAACNRPRAQVCFVRPSLGEQDIFHLSVVSWMCPFNDPRNPERAAYYLEGHFMGLGEKGFDQILRELASRKSVIFIGSSLNNTGGFASEELPFARREHELSELLHRNGVQRIHPSYMFFP